MYVEPSALHNTANGNAWGTLTFLLVAMASGTECSAIPRIFSSTVVLHAPLRDWFPRAAFALKKTVVLKHPKGRSNPTVVMEHDRMDGAALVDDLVEPLLGLSWTVPKAA